jgi:hypothetical protein
MTSAREGSGLVSSFVLRFFWGALPIAICILLLRLSADSRTSPPLFIAVCAVAAIVLWFGWKSVRRNVITKWIGVVLGLYFGLVLSLSAFGIAIGLLLVLLPLILVLFPLVVYDLFFRGRFKRQSDRAPAKTPTLTQ